jgi:SAM-dependent methyltransferase
VEFYFGLDAYRDASPTQTRLMVRELAQLFESHAAIPDADEFPELWPPLQSYAFPEWLRPDASETNIRTIEAEVDAAFSDPSGRVAGLSGLAYRAPWAHAEGVVRGGSFDLVFSQAVMEHVDDARHIYRQTRAWLATGGVSSHTIDFRSHGLTSTWYGHWLFRGGWWRMVEAGGVNHLNRLALSHHLRLLREERHRIAEVIGSEVASAERALAGPIADARLDSRDAKTQGAYVLAVAVN